jgi:hypothetical protein
MIARRIFTKLRDGICRVGDAEEAQNIIDDWQKLHYDERLVTIETFFDSSRSGSEMDMDSDDEDLEAQLQRELNPDGFEIRMLR